MRSNRSRYTVSERVQKYRQRLRAQGLRPVQIWVPDVRSSQFAAEAHRQSAAVAASERARDDQAFIDAVSLSHPQHRETAGDDAHPPHAGLT